MLKLILRKFVGTVKIVRSVRDSTLLGLNSKRRVFQRLTKVLDIAMLEITNNLKLDLLEILVFECNFYSKSSNLLENANMLSLTKEATNKDHSLKTQLTINSKSSKEKISGKRVEKSGIF